jgi:type IV secretory pathway VirB6-like protein
MALLLTVYDSAIYGTCEYIRHHYTVAGVNFSTFLLAIPDYDPDGCTNSYGYKMLGYYLGYGWHYIDLIFFSTSTKGGCPCDN